MVPFTKELLYFSFQFLFPFCDKKRKKREKKKNSFYETALSNAFVFLSPFFQLFTVAFYQIFQLLSTLFENFLVIVIFSFFFSKDFSNGLQFGLFDLFDWGFNRRWIKFYNSQRHLRLTTKKSSFPIGSVD